ncbi:MAG: serine protease [Planctomycetota bacterium]
MIRTSLAISLLAIASLARLADAGLFSPRVGAAPHPAVCRIAVEERDGQAFGSGTLIDAREQFGLVVTNWHVVRDATGKIEVRFPDGHTSEARPLKLDETWDLAALVIWRPPTEPVRLASRPPQQGDQLTICGYGGGDYRALTGRCTDYYSPEVGEPQELVELNVEARQGDSGGPIFNRDGELAGVLFGAARGTTLGSFGGRVQTFLASLAPDIGKGQPAMLAGATTTPLSRERPVDPFLVAEQSPPKPGPIQAAAPPPPPALSDRNSAPQLATARQPADAWQPAPPVQRPASSQKWFAAPAEPTTRWAPQTSGVAAREPSATPVDWTQDTRTLLAVFGVAALLVSALRVAS